MVNLFWMLQVVDDDFGRTKNFIAPLVTSLKHLQDGVVGLGRIVAL
jgi:hypothetical protein